VVWKKNIPMCVCRIKGCRNECREEGKHFSEREAEMAGKNSGRKNEWSGLGRKEEGIRSSGVEKGGAGGVGVFFVVS